MKLEIARKIANYYVDIFSPACNRIEIVGSTKRGDKTEVHDIEILMILNGKRPRPEFGDKEIYPTILDKILSDLKQEGNLRDPARKANGEKYKKFAIVESSHVSEFCLDLFIVTPKTWGIQNVIRTGPSLFSHSFVTNQGIVFFDRDTQARYKGLLPVQYSYVAGETKILEGDNELILPEEKDALDLLGHGWVEPNKRRELIVKS